MGCPKAFSIQGGMGAALLSKPELIHDVLWLFCTLYMLLFLMARFFLKHFTHVVSSLSQILTTLKRNLDVPVTCKIRLLKSTADTVELARRIEKLGVPALAVHGR